MTAKAASVLQWIIALVVSILIAVVGGVWGGAWKVADVRQVAASVSTVQGTRIVPSITKLEQCLEKMTETIVRIGNKQCEIDTRLHAAEKTIEKQQDEIIRTLNTVLIEVRKNP